MGPSLQDLPTFQESPPSPGFNMRFPKFSMLKVNLGGFPGGTVVKNLPANAGDTVSSPGPGRSHMPQSN